MKMKKTIIISIVSIFMLAIFNFSCATDKELKSAVVEETVKAKAGSDVEIELPANPSTGFMWDVYKNQKPKVAKVELQRYISPEDNGMIGGAGKDLFIFNTFKKGETIVIFKYAKKDEEDKIVEVEKTKIYKIIVE